MFKSITVVAFVMMMATIAANSNANEIGLSTNACRAWVEGVHWVYYSVSPKGDLKFLQSAFSESDTWSLADDDHEKLIKFLSRYHLTDTEQSALIETLSYSAIERYYGLFGLEDVRAVYRSCQ